jgi:hypothetical protein
VVTLATAAVAGYIRDLPIGVSALRAEMVAAVMNIDGVTNIVMSAPAADVTASASTKLMPGTITFS